MANSLLRRFGVPSLVFVAAFCGGTVTGIAMTAQPHMANALTDLNAAKNQLSIAEADKGGHRTNAINFVNGAIAQVEAGIAAGAR